ncbi:MAG: restriction endonuclease subunit S [Sulfuriferula sp.]
MKNQKEDVFEPAIPVVPEGWDVLPFEQAANVVSDKSKRVKQRDYLQSGKLAVIDQGQDFIGGYTNDKDMAFEGELPVILFGDHTRSIKYVDRPFAVGADGVKILKPAVGFDTKYFYYLLRSLQIPSRGYSRHFQFLRKFHFPRAPLDQQKRIVAEIDKQFSRLDEAVANLKRVKANLKRYKAAILKAAVEGHLVETEAELACREGRSYETGVQLLQRILETRRCQWQGKGKYKEPAAPDTTNLPELPEGWVWASPEQLSMGEPYSLAIGPFGSSLKVSDYSDTGVPLVFVRNIRAVSFGGPGTVYVSEEKAKELRAHRVDAGDLLVTKMGDPPGDVCIYPAHRPPAVITADCIKLRLARDYASTHFFAYAIESDLAQKQILGITKGVAQLKVSLGRFGSIGLPLPPMAEQHRIVAEVDRRLSLLRETEAQVVANLQRAERLRKSVLASVFSYGLYADEQDDQRTTGSGVGDIAIRRHQHVNSTKG